MSAPIQFVRTMTSIQISFWFSSFFSYCKQSTSIQIQNARKLIEITPPIRRNNTGMSVITMLGAVDSIISFVYWCHIRDSVANSSRCEFLKNRMRLNMSIRAMALFTLKSGGQHQSTSIGLVKLTNCARGIIPAITQLHAFPHYSSFMPPRTPETERNGWLNHINSAQNFSSITVARGRDAQYCPSLSK